MDPGRPGGRPAAVHSAAPPAGAGRLPRRPVQAEAAGHGHPPGRQFHVAARKGTDYLVVDVRESQEALDRFLQTLLPLIEQAGSMHAQPQIYPIHNIIEGT